MLKLIFSQARPIQQVSSITRVDPKPISEEPFSTNTTLKTPGLYIMKAQDPSHGLSCEVILEIELNQTLTSSKTVICHFPQISGEELSIIIEEDELFYDSLMDQFQMKVMEQLILFCSSHCATSLVIYNDEPDTLNLRTYNQFRANFGYQSNHTGDGSKLIISINHQFHRQWVDYMNEVSLKFRQELWQNQRKCYVTKNYLSRHPLGESRLP